MVLYLGVPTDAFADFNYKKWFLPVMSDESTI